MKKLLSILASLGLTATSASAVVSCSTALPGSSNSFINGDPMGRNHAGSTAATGVAPSKDGTVTQAIPDVTFKNGIPSDNELKIMFAVTGPDGKAIPADYKFIPNVSNAYVSFALSQAVTGSIKVTFKPVVTASGAKATFTVASTPAGNAQLAKPVEQTVPVDTKDVPPVPVPPSFSGVKWTKDNQYDSITITGSNMSHLEAKNLTIKVGNENVDFNSSITFNGDTSAIVKLDNPIQQTTSDQTIDITYTPELGDVIKNSLTILAGPHFIDDQPVTGDLKTITIAAKGLVNDGHLIDDTVVEQGNGVKKELDSVVITSEGNLQITLKDSFTPSYYKDETATIVFHNVGFSMNASYTINKDTSLAPKFTSATYIEDKKEIVIGGNNINQLGTINKDNFTGIDKIKSLINDITSDKSSITIHLNDILPEDEGNYFSFKPTIYSIGYKDNNSGMELNSTFSVKLAPRLEASASLVNPTTVKVFGYSLLDTNDAHVVSVDKKNVVKSSSVSNDVLTINLANQIDPVYWTGQNFKFSFTTEGKTFTTELIVNKDYENPVFKDARYDLSSKEITVRGLNLSKLNSVDFKNLVIKDENNKALALSDQDKASIVNDNEITIALNKGLQRQETTSKYSVAYTDQLETINTSFEVQPLPTFTTINYDGNTTITIKGNNLIDDAKANVSVEDVLDKDMKESKPLAISNANVVNNVLTINLKDKLDPLYWTSQKLSVNYTDWLGYELPVQTWTINQTTDQPVFTSATYNGNDKTVTINGSDLSVLGINDSNKSGFSFGLANVNVDSIKYQNDQQIVLGLKDSIGLADKEQSVSVSYNDGHDTKGLSANFTVPAKPSLEANASYDGNKTITVKGTNLGNGDVTKDVSINGLNVTSATTDGTTLTIKISNSINKEYWTDQKFNINYAIGGLNLIAGFEIAQATDEIPEFTSAGYSAINKTLSISGQMLNNLYQDASFDASSFKIDGYNGLISVISKNDRLLELSLNGSCIPSNVNVTYVISHKDGSTTKLNAIVNAAYVIGEWVDSQTADKDSGNGIPEDDSILPSNIKKDDQRTDMSAPQKDEKQTADYLTMRVDTTKTKYHNKQGFLNNVKTIQITYDDMYHTYGKGKKGNMDKSGSTVFEDSNSAGFRKWNYNDSADISTADGTWKEFISSRSGATDDYGQIKASFYIKWSGNVLEVHTYFEGVTHWHHGSSFTTGWALVTNEKIRDGNGNILSYQSYEKPVRTGSAEQNDID